MRVTIGNGVPEVCIEAEGSYAPDVMADLCARAVEVYALAFADEDET